MSVGDVSSAKGRSGELCRISATCGEPYVWTTQCARCAKRCLAAAALAMLFTLGMSSTTVAGERGAIGDLYVSSWSSSKVVQYDGQTGAYVCDFVASGSGGLSRANALTWGPNGNLFVCSDGKYPPYNTGVAEYDGTTGEFIGWLVGPDMDADSRWAVRPFQPLFGPDGNLYVSAGESENVLKYDGVTGEWLDTMMGGFSPGGLRRPYGMAFGPNNNLYVVSGYDASNPDGVGRGIFEYHHATGNLVRMLAGSLNVAMPRESSLLFHPNGHLLLTSTDMDLITGQTYCSEVLEFDVATGELLGAFVPNGTGLNKGNGMAWGPNGNLFVISRNTSSVIEYDGETGALIGTFASGGGLIRPMGLAFKPPPPTALEAPAISGVSVVALDAAQPLTGVVVTGSGLDPAATKIKLARAGEPDYVGVVTGGDSSSLTVDFDFDGGAIASGLWDVVATNLDGQSDALTAAIDITGCRSVRQGNLLTTTYRHRTIPGSTIHGILEYDEAGNVVGWFAEDKTHGDSFGELWLAPGLAMGGPDGNVYVACGRSGAGAVDGYHAVVRFDIVTGARLGVFVPTGSGGLQRPYGLTFGPGGNLFVVDRPHNGNASAVFEYDGESGAFVRVFIQRGACGLTNGRELFFDGNGHLFATSEDNGVIEFDENGVCIGVLGATGELAGAAEAACISPRTGRLVVANASSQGGTATEYDPASGDFVRTLIRPGAGGWALSVEGSATFGPNGNFFVTSAAPGEILEFNGLTGHFIRLFGSVEIVGGNAAHFDLLFVTAPAGSAGDSGRPPRPSGVSKSSTPASSTMSNRTSVPGRKQGRLK